MSGPGDPIAEMISSELASDLDTLTKTQLRQKYKGEANSHRNMLQRAGKNVHKDFRALRSFLRLVGPKPTASSTLDRIDNSDPEYAPGKVRWADKRTQNANKGDTVTFHNSRTGEVYTTSRLAKLQGVSTDAIRKRHARGWSDDEIIAGKQSSNQSHYGAPDVDDDLPAVPALAKYGARALTEQEVRALSADELRTIADYGGRARSRHGGRQTSEHEARLLQEHKYTLQEFAEARAAGEHEPLPAHYVFLNKEMGWDITFEMSVRHLRRSWHQYKPYVRYSNCDPIHQKIIAEIDPEFVKAAKEKEARIAELASVL